ncbi:radical SAM protein [Candidatus Omnitrophota bacterium]
MRIYRKEFELLKKAQSIVRSRFSHLGINKKREITRLLYEISKKQNAPPSSIVRDIDSKDFDKLKAYLLKTRFPYAYLNNEIPRPYLPKIRLNTSFVSDAKKTRFYPKRIIVEKSAQRSHLAERFRKFFPKAISTEIKSLKDYLKQNKGFTTESYNKRRDTAFITYENYDFFKKCPCTKRAVACGYHIFNLSFGCIFECTFCYLQEYTNSPGLIFPANIDRFFKAFDSYKRRPMRIGTGEFSDSLMLDHITEYSFPIIDFFKKHKHVLFEFKTKSDNISNLLKINHAGNIVVSWSLNPQKIIDENELLAPSLNKRILSAKRCSEAGYKLAFHFDPVVYFKGWQKAYERVIESLFSSIDPRHISWISIGTLRFNPKVKPIIEARFPGNKILDEELVLGFDSKLRYPYSMRSNIYKSMIKMLFKHSKKLPIYLCMEHSSMWRDLNPAPNFFTNRSI